MMVGNSGGGIAGIVSSGSGIVGNWGHSLDHSWGSIVSHSGGSIVGNGSSSNGLHNWGNGNSLDEGFTVDDSVESVDGIGGVLDCALVTISIDQRVLSTDHITIAFLDLALGVAGEGILDIVGVLVLGMGIVFLGSLGDHMLGYWGNGLDNGSWGGIGGHSWSCMVDLSSGQDASAGSGDQSENCDELKII